MPSTSSLKPLSATEAGIPEMPPPAWHVVPGQESQTVLKSPRLELPDPVPSSMPTPSFWKRLFPPQDEAAATSPPNDLAQGVALGHFTIEKRIGVGAMGAVFLAFDERLHRDVALKILAPSQGADHNTVQRFQNEAQAAARLDHEHVARVFYYGEEGGLHFIAYEYVAGVNLRDLLRQRGRLAPAEAVNYAIQIATALRHTTRHGVVHRDIKPSNIIVAPNGRAKLVDLGLAKRDGIEPGGELTVAGTTLGTFDYISPEQARDPRSVDVRSDIYSLGCTLYHLLTGEPPYPQGTVLQKLLDHQAHDTPDAAAKNRRVSPAFSAVIKRMMSSDVKRRYATPEELLRDLAIIARDLGLRVVASDSAALVPASQLQGTWWDRNFGWVLTAAALLLIVAGLQAAPELVEKTARWTDNFGAAPPDAPSSPDTAAPSSLTNTPTVGISDPSQEHRTADDDPKLSQMTPEFAAGKYNDDHPAPDTETQADAATSVTATTDTVAVPSTAVSTPAAVEVKLPAISIVNGGKKSGYASLEQVCQDAKDGDIIELRYDGVRSSAEQVLRLANKHLTIRAAKGHRPQLDFTDPSRAGDQSATRIITVSSGSLHLVNVDLVAHVSPSSSSGWALFSLERPESLKLEDVTITVVNPRRRAASVIEQVSAGLSGSGIKAGMPLLPPEIQLSRCVIRGAAALLTVRDAVAGRFSVVDSLIAIDDSLLQMLARQSMNMGDNQPLKVELLHTTVMSGGSLIVSRPEDDLNDQPLPLHVVARNNLISVGREQPLIDMSVSDAMELRESFVWSSGERNFYNDVKSFWVIRTKQKTTSLDFAAWKESWGSEVSGSSNQPIRWVGDLRSVSLQDLKLDDATLLTSGGPNPAIGAATDGTDLGAPLDKLPPPPKVDAAK